MMIIIIIIMTEEIGANCFKKKKKRRRGLKGYFKESINCFFLVGIIKKIAENQMKAG